MADRLSIVKKFIPSIQTLLDRVMKIYEADLAIHKYAVVNSITSITSLLFKINESMVEIDDFLNNDSVKSNQVFLIDKNLYINSLLDNIKSKFIHILEDGMYYNTEVSRPYIYETKKFLNKFVDEFMIVRRSCDKLDNVIIKDTTNKMYDNLLIGDGYITDKFEKLSNEFRKYVYTWFVYVNITNKLLDHLREIDDIKTITQVLDINEQNKDYILNYVHMDDIHLNSTNPDKMTNPQLTTFTLIPITDLMTIDQLADLLKLQAKPLKLQAKPSAGLKLDDFVKICKTKKVDVIVIKKYLNRGIQYDILTLLDYTKSKTFSINNSADDGITKDTIDRFTNIKYISKLDKSTLMDFKSEYIYKFDEQSTFDILVIEELYPGKYHIMSNTMAYTDFDLKSVCIKHDQNPIANTLLNKSKKITRIDNYNNYMNKNILSNMFLEVLPNIAELQKVSKVDPTYLKNSIYRGIVNKYEELDTKPMKSIFDFSKLIHSSEFSNTFEMIITDYYYNYIEKTFDLGDISKSEIYTSFANITNIYNRDFNKKIHDEFMKEIPNIAILNIFENPPQKIKAELLAIFEKLLLDILNVIITIDVNLFQSIDYKIKLLKFARFSK
jgi:hypothetical protein